MNMPNCKLVMRGDRLAPWNLELSSHMTVESEFSTNKTVTNDVLEACAPNSNFSSFKQRVQYTNVPLKYLSAWWYFWCLLCFWFLSLVLANLCQEPITYLRYYFPLLFRFSLFVSYCSFLSRAFRGSARQAFLVKFSLILLLKFRHLTPPYNSYLIFITLVMLPCRCGGLIP